MRTLRDEYGFDTVAMHRQLLRLARIGRDRQVLDMGTGSGWMAMILAEGGHKVVAMDVDSAMLVRARQRWQQASPGLTGQVRFVQADAQRLPFRSSGFDAVFSFDVLHHLPDCPRAVAELLRVRKASGVFAVGDLNPKGLRAVEEVMSRDSEYHFDNGCRVEKVAEVLERERLQYERHDLEFVTAYILRPDDTVQSATNLSISTDQKAGSRRPQLPEYSRTDSPIAPAISLGSQPSTDRCERQATTAKGFGRSAGSQEFKTVSIHSTRPEITAVRSQIASEAARREYTESELFALTLGLEEALANAYAHGNHQSPNKLILVRYRIGDYEIEVQVLDEGEGFDPSRVPDPTDAEHIGLEHGRGLLLMRAFLDVVRFCRSGTCVELVKRRGAGSGALATASM